MKPIELPTLTPAGPGALTPEDTTRLAAEVRALAEERNAVILAHNYQVPEVQEVADVVGDSLQLSQRAAATDADVIAFCGVHFMAETASILSPDKTVLLPDEDAGCSLAESITAEQLRAWKARHPGAVVVMYVNTSAAVKHMLSTGQMLDFAKAAAPGTRAIVATETGMLFPLAEEAPDVEFIAAN